MHLYEPKKFNLPQLDGISEKSLEEHLGLYAGYVKNFNAISAAIAEYAKDSEKHSHALSELIRRRSFEFDGMRLHELYFSQFETGPAQIAGNSPLAQAFTNAYGSTEHATQVLKAIGLMRGPGWAILYQDPETGELLTGFSGEQHQGHFATLPIILALDVWEHAFLLDYGAQGKGKYIDAFFKNLNWGVIEGRLQS
jgi:superoxide dismutase, Fe-Mn family